jgi:hypothetical protein
MHHSNNLTLGHDNRGKYATYVNLTCLKVATKTDSATIQPELTLTTDPYGRRPRSINHAFSYGHPVTLACIVAFADWPYRSDAEAVYLPRTSSTWQCGVLVG